MDLGIYQEALDSIPQQLSDERLHIDGLPQLPQEIMNAALTEPLDSVMESGESQELSPAEVATLTIDLQHYRELFEFAPDGYLVTDIVGEIQQANRAATILLGGVDVVGQNLVSFVTPSATEPFQRLLGQLQRGQNVKSRDMLLQFQTGQSFEAKFTILSVRSAKGEVTSLRWWLQDVTEYKQEVTNWRRSHQRLELKAAQLQAQLNLLDNQLKVEQGERQRISQFLARTESRFKSLVKQSSELIEILDGDGTIQYCGAAIMKLLGYQPDQRVQQSFFTLLHPDDMTKVQTFLTQTIASHGKSSTLIYRRLHINGDWIYLESRFNNLLHDSSVQGIVVNSQDITQRRLAVEALRKAHSQLEEQTAELAIVHREQQTAVEKSQSAETDLHLRETETLITRKTLESERQYSQAVLNFTSDAYLVTDIHGVIRESNQAATQLLSIAHNSLIGKPLTVFVAEEDRKGFRTQLYELGDLSLVTSWEVHLQGQGSPFLVAIMVAATIDTHGRVGSLRWLIRNLSYGAMLTDGEDEPRRSIAADLSLLDLLLNLYAKGERDFIGIDLAGQTLRGVNLTGADLQQANLSGATLNGSRLQGANLQWTNLRGADLRGADLQHANLRESDLRGADLRGCDFQDADLTGALLDEGIPIDRSF